MMTTARFQKEIYKYYAMHRRDFPWRIAGRLPSKKHAYKILVSEVMLQQTQVKRVLSFYPEFTRDLPDVRALATAPISKVLKLWQGLGYNRRALMLQRAAQEIMTRYGGHIPANYENLLVLPGVGPSTAAGIMNFAFGIPTPYLETNVRSVYLHFFFSDASCKLVHDKEILPILEKTMDTSNPRDWFYALLDYGAMLKKTHTGLNQKSAHYMKQSPFEGSRRQARAKALRDALKSGAKKSDLLTLLS